mmetsp:Transcript_16047/g.30062  ORF Transcript_16047/g.30062 Transcript_16047/m.30062 type:complete len:214 (-) Transcript_16047:170-811(-)
MTYLSILLFFVFLTSTIPSTISFTINNIPNYRRNDDKTDAILRNFRNGDVCRSSLGHGQDNIQDDNTQDEGDDDEEIFYTFPPLSSNNLKTLRKHTSFLRKSQTLPTHYLLNSSETLNPSSLTELSTLLNQHEIVECRSILKSSPLKTVLSSIYEICETLNVSLVSFKGHSAVLYRPQTSGIKFHESNNADGSQFVKKERTERDSRGRPLSGG